MDRLDAMKTFVRVVEAGSFSAVARELGIGQPAVSKQIAALEEHVGAQLVRRTSRSMSVTQAGSDFYDVALRLVRELDSAIADVGRGDSSVSGLVRLSVAPVFGRLYVLPLLRKLFTRYPNLSVELSVSERTVDLVDENVDVAIRSGNLADSALLVRPIGSTPLLTVASAEYLAKHRAPKRPSELQAHAHVVFVAHGAPRPWRYLGSEGSIVFRPRGSFRSNDAEQIREAVLANLGIAQTPGWLVAAELSSGRVRAILREHDPAPIPISAVRPGGRPLTTKVRVLLDFLIAAFRKEPMLGVDG